jgi:phage host-nuclease inhibitor protein Gam
MMSDSVNKLREQQLERTSVDRQEWTINSMELATWAGRKITHARNEITAITKWRDAEIQRIKDAADIEIARHQNEVTFLEGHLGLYLHQLIQEGRKTKTLNLPTGTVSIRARQPKLTFNDEARAISWASDYFEDAVIVKKSVNLTALKKRVEVIDDGTVIDSVTGELLDFVNVEQQAPVVSFKPEEQNDTLTE